MNCTLAREWQGCDVVVEGHGNCLVAIAAMHGLKNAAGRKALAGTNGVPAKRAAAGIALDQLVAHMACR